MKEINLKEFIQLPSGTIYTQWGPICLKGDSISEDDFFYDQLTPTMTVNKDFDMGTSRWGEFDDEAIFIVYDKEDVKELVCKLNHRQ